MKRLALVAAALLGACGDDARVQPPSEVDEVDAGVPLPTALRPGPCSAIGHGQWDSEITCTFTYDDERRPLEAHCVDDYGADGAYGSFITWTYADGALATVRHSRQEIEGGSIGETYTFGADAVTWSAGWTSSDGYSWNVADRVHDRATFALLGVIFDEQAWVDADDSLVSEHHEWGSDLGDEYVEDAVFTYAPPEIPVDGERVRTASDGVSRTFEYAGGHRVDGGYYTWDGDRLVGVGGRTYEYDAFGNLLRRVVGDQITAYDYRCWE